MFAPVQERLGPCIEFRSGEDAVRRMSAFDEGVVDESQADNILRQPLALVGIFYQVAS